MSFKYVCSEPDCLNAPTYVMRDGSLWCGQHPTFVIASREAKPVAKHNHSWSSLFHGDTESITIYFRICHVCGTRLIVEESPRVVEQARSATPEASQSEAPSFGESLRRIDALTALQATAIAELRRKIDELAQPYAQAVRPIDVAIASAKRAAQRWVAMMETHANLAKARAGLETSGAGWFPASQAVIEAHGDEVVPVQQAWREEALRLINEKLNP